MSLYLADFFWVGEIILDTKLANLHEPILVSDGGIVKIIPCVVVEDVLQGELADHSKI